MAHRYHASLPRITASFGELIIRMVYFVCSQAQENVDACCQRWFYAGKLLGDKILLEDSHIQEGHVVQVIVNTEHYNHGTNS